MIVAAQVRHINRFVPAWIAEEPAVIAMAVFVLNVVYKGIYLDSQSIASDEPFSIFVAQWPPTDIIRHLATGNNPPLWELLLHYWIQVFGTGTFSVRVMPLIFSSLSAVMVFMIGNRFVSRGVGIMASLLFTFSNFHIHFAHEARSYSLLTFLTCASMYLYLEIIRGRAKLSSSHVLWSLCNALLVYTHFFGAWVVGVQFLVYLVLTIDNRQTPSKWPVLIGFGATLALYSPYISVLLHRFQVSASQGTYIPPPNGFYSIVDMLRAFTNERFGTERFYGTKPLMSALFIIGSVAGHLRVMKQWLAEDKAVYLAIGAWFLVPFFSMWLLSFRIPMFYDRYISFVCPGYLLLLSIGISSISNNHGIRLFFMGLTVILMVLTSQPDVSNRRDFRAAAEKIRELRHQHRDAPIFICPDWYDITFAYHWGGDCFSMQPSREGMEGNNVKDRLRECLAGQSVHPLWNEHMLGQDLPDRLIYLDGAAEFSYPGNGILERLSSSYSYSEEYGYPEIFRVYLFRGVERPPLRLADDSAADSMD